MQETLNFFFFWHIHVRVVLYFNGPYVFLEFTLIFQLLIMEFTQFYIS
jgi:hypothetical protein